MKELYNEYLKFDNFLKMQLLIVFIISFCWSLVIPIVTKLEGLLWSTSLISFFMILNKLSVFVSPYLKKLSLKETYKYLVYLDIAYFGSIFLYFIDPLWFLYFDSILMLIYSVIMNVFGINYDAFLMKNYNETIFKDIQYIERMIMASAGIFGLIIVIFIGYFFSLNILMITFSIFLFINVCFQIYNYKTFWKTINV